MPSYYNKITVMDGNSVIREIDLSQDTVASAADIMSGKYGHLNTGERVLGTGQGGGGVSRTVIAAQQTVNVSSFFTQLSATEALTLGEVYSFTLDGTEYIGTATDNGGLPSVGGADFYATGQNGAVSSYGDALYLVCQTNGQHTIKVEKLTGI